MSARKRTSDLLMEVKLGIFLLLTFT